MRCESIRYLCFQLGVLCVTATVLAQETESEDDTEVGRPNETAEQRETLEQCAMAQGAIDVSILDDRHVYIRTRGSNHYLLTTEQCDRLYTAYLRQEVQLVPYGRSICRSDGSYLRYLIGGRPQTCYIEHVQRVDDRAAARELAAGRSPSVGFEPVELDPDRATDPETTQPESR